MFAAGFIFMCYLVLHPQKHFRHILILNLAFAGQFNPSHERVDVTNNDQFF
jgi:hypothetical protein